MTLEDLAGEAKGIKRWGIFRADVDSLGRVFAEGLGSDRTMSRVTMLSSLLSLFFSLGVDEKLRVKEFENKANIVYSGGDDLFILGSWSVLPEIAHKIYKDFRRFTCHNLTLSGGIYLAPSKKFPVYQAAQEAGQAVDKSKEKEDKNSLTLFDRVIPWCDLAKINEITEQLRVLLEDYGSNSAPRSLLSTLYAGWQEKELVEKKEIPLPRIWRLFYAFKKLMRGYKEGDPQLSELQDLLKKSITDFDLMPYIDIAVRWADYLTRKEAKYEGL
jgi:CRISPR-associated protein Csm1